MEQGSILMWTGKTRAQISFSGLHEKGRTNVRGNCCILLAEGNICCLCHTPRGLLAELCSVTVGLSSWLTKAHTRAQSNLVSFVTLRVLHLPVGECLFQSNAKWEGELSVCALQEKCRGLSVCSVFAKAWKSKSCNCTVTWPSWVSGGGPGHKECTPPPPFLDYAFSDPG